MPDEFAPPAESVRSYSLHLQVAMTIELGEFERWEDIEAEIRDTGSYTLLTPWEDIDVTAVIVNG